MLYNSKNKIAPNINTTYKSVSGTNLPLSVYLPEGFDKAKKYSAVIAIHGGGWYAVSPESPEWTGGAMGHNAKYYQSKGFVGITFSYRSINFSPDTEVKDLIKDCFDALVYIKNNFDFIDFEKIVLMGDSAGGHLALSLIMGLTLHSDLPFYPQFAAICNPVTDCVCEKWSYSAKTDGARKEASPLYNAKCVLPKILLIHGTADTCVDINDTRSFFEKMKAAGSDVELIELDGRKHAFIVYRFRDSDEEIAAVHEMIDKYID